MKKFWIQVFALILFTFGSMLLYVNNDYLTPLIGTGWGGQIEQSKLKIKTANQEVLVNIELADNQAKRNKGLGGRESLATDSGMLFVFESVSKKTFWMKDLSFPLDFIWINGDTVVDVLVNVPPPERGQADDTLPRIQPISDVDKVLEVNAGYIEKNGIKVGDKVEILRVEN